MARDIGRSVGRAIREESSGRGASDEWKKPKMERVGPPEESEAPNSASPGGKERGKMRRIGHELKVNPPRVLARTRARKGKAAAEKQRVAILMSKAGVSKKG